MHIPGNVVLFEGIEEKDVVQLLSCFTVRHTVYRKGDTILREGDSVDSVGVILSGSIQIIRSDLNGNRSIQAVFGMGAVFAESFVFAGIKNCPVAVLAAEDSSILFIPAKKMLHTCKTACGFHLKLVENIAGMLARKNMILNEKLEIISGRSIRERVILYLSREARRQNSRRVQIPFSRTELADYICVDRSALSRELGTMRSEKVIDFEGARIIVIN